MPVVRNSPSSNRIIQPHIHVETRNLSFLQVSEDLRRLGIKNNKFFLKLYDRDLIGVDPYQSNLPKELIQKIIVECMINPWYFKREVAKIETPGGAPINYVLNRGDLAASWCFYNHIDFYLSLPRQIGKTQGRLSDVNWAFLFGTNNTEMSFSNINQTRAAANLYRLKIQRSFLPSYLQFKVIENNDGKLDSGIDNTLSIVSPVNNNKIVATSSPTSPEKADEIGRGTTNSIIYIDEVDFIKYIDIMMDAIGPSYINTARNAKKTGAAHCRMMTSTPGDLDSVAGKSAMNIINATCQFTENFYDWDAETIDEYIRLNSNNRICYIEYSYKQLGKDEEWFRETCIGVSNNPLKIKREILLQRMRGSDLSPYDMKDLTAISELLTPVLEEVVIAKYFILYVYRKLDRERGYIIGVDVASGVGNDNSAVVILDPVDCKPVAEFKSPNISIPQLRDFLRILIIKYVPRSVLAIERNNQGVALIQILLETDISSRIYFDKKNIHEADLSLKFDKNGWLEHNAKMSAEMGVWTGTQSREMMFNLLETHILEYKDRLCMKFLLDDIYALVKDKRGKIQAGAGEHDDVVMAYNISLYVYYYGKNLRRFGISKALPESVIEELSKDYEEDVSAVYDYMEEAGMEVIRYSEEDYNQIVAMRERDRILRERQNRNIEEKHGYAETLDYYEDTQGNIVNNNDGSDMDDLIDLFYNPDSYKY